MRSRRFEILVTLGLVSCWVGGLGIAGFHFLDQGGFWCRHETSDPFGDSSFLAFIAFSLLLWLTTAGLALGCWRRALGRAESGLCIGLALLHALLGATAGGLATPCL